MPVITAIKFDKSGSSARIYLDGAYALSISGEEVLKKGLKTGQVVESNQLENMELLQERLRCYRSACRLISYRPRSENEIRERLKRKNFNPELVEQVINQLRESKLIDDVAFARFWVENRAMFRPQSLDFTIWELKRKGLTEKEASEAVKHQDDFENGCLAAASRINRLASLDYENFRKRLSGFLARRGFKYEIIKKVVEKTWKEVDTQGAS